MDDLNEYFRRKRNSRPFDKTVDTVLDDTFSKLQRELGRETGIVGIVSSPAPPSDGNTTEYSTDFYTCFSRGNDVPTIQENAAVMLANIALRYADSPTETREIVHDIANRAQQVARLLCESTSEDE